MKNLLLVLLLIFACSIAKSQSNNCIKNYKKGTKAIQSNDYLTGIKYLTISIDDHPTPNAYYNRAAAYRALGDTCSFCNDLKKASDLNDQDAKNLFIEQCTYKKIVTNIPDSIRKKHKEIKDIQIVHLKCNSDSTLVIINNDELLNVYKTDDYNDDNSPVFTIVENMPSFPEGDYARQIFLSNNIKYPELAAKNKIQGITYVSFIVDKNGEITDVKTLRGIGGGCDEEAVRVIKMMPRWNPGTQNGKPVRVLFNMPIYFKLQGQK